MLTSLALNFEWSLWADIIWHIFFVIKKRIQRQCFCLNNLESRAQRLFQKGSRRKQAFKECLIKWKMTLLSLKNESTVFAKVLGSILRCKERKGMRSPFCVCIARVTFPFLEIWLVLGMDHLKSDECGGEGREMFSLHDHIFFFQRDKHEYFYSGAEIFIFFIVVVVFWKYTQHFLDCFTRY